MIYDADPYLSPYREAVTRRCRRVVAARQELAGYGKPLADIAVNHLYYGVHAEKDSVVFREWAPNATAVYLIGEMNGWRKDGAYRMNNVGGGNWELRLPASEVPHGTLYKWYVEWNGGSGERLPAYAFRCVQDPVTKIFSAQVWLPPKKYRWKHRFVPHSRCPLIYEAHVGMSSEEEKVASFDEFRINVLPRIHALGYDTLQLMALQEHPYYGSFGYQVSNFFALSSRFGTPEEFKALVDEAHGMGMAVVMDIVHSHASANEAEGIGMLDGTDYLYCHGGERGRHPAWGSRCFDYGNQATVRFLLSNIKYWMEEYHIDGFRFDGVTSMIYLDHGLGKDFTDYSCYFDGNQDEDALTYLGLANILVKEINPKAVTIAEDVSGMPGLAAPLKDGGIGFDFRLSMGIADHWIKWIKERRDEDWSMGEIYYELTNKRKDERTVSYAECHDQALVGDKTIIFRLMDKEMYTAMNKDSRNLTVDRGIALHKMIRLVTIATAGDGYLNFMGNEFGHPEWIDFPREGNGWSYFYARRQWSLADNPDLRYGQLLHFDKAMVHLFSENNILLDRPHLIHVDESQKVLIFGRGSFIFAFNFHPVLSVADFRFGAAAGEYRPVLDTDAVPFGGFGRNDGNMPHFTVRENDRDLLSLYLPSRSAMVLKRH
ncbi:MAG TPA: alpha amylase C-terminal domain-containing protein [Candidatus Coprenecus stercoravium]|uniref:1,4-alpha-glucan branching enzyme n=1 Tax=Candidatus Coprenecus stercoravium TaxID=2840735 RepID=A0A9D2GSM9_9BACT|nr:alpha amylase C-terminal domain-containing protein [Candidatus Coprenecus stercoravium]